MTDRENTRPSFPEKVVITAGMPYGNKNLHFGHIGGVFIHADIFARFMRDRIGTENVVFVSGTDCYGSSIEIGYKEAVAGGFSGSIEEYVERNHQSQKETLDNYQVSLNLFGASALGEAGKIHTDFSDRIFRRLYEQGALYLEETVQFYDEEQSTFLNGRQVVGYCPINGCKSERAYADECSLGHQYDPSELINPISVLSGKTPARVPVKNWFFNLPEYQAGIKNALESWQRNPGCRESLIHVVNEFLKKPSIYVKKELIDSIKEIEEMPSFQVIEEEQKMSWALEFSSLKGREQAAAVLKQHGIRCRTGKTVVPLRLSGNVDWGIPVPEIEDMTGLTFWVWPESLWAPISFTKTYLGDGVDGKKWEEWWKGEGSQVYHFIGEDNIYFYAVAEMGMLAALDEKFQTPLVIPNHHLLFGKRKASSSGEIKPPTAAELLDYYTPEQLRLHFMNASLTERSVGFEPKALMQKPNEFDTVLYEGNLLTNVLNRLVRSGFYTLQKMGEGVYPAHLSVTPSVKEASDHVILEYERMMSELRFDKIFELLNIYLKEASKNWAQDSKSEDEQTLLQILIDTFHVVRVSAALFHPIAPDGCEMIREYLDIDERVWDWKYIFEPLSFFTGPNKKFRHLEPRVDFFSKHPSQLKK